MFKLISDGKNFWTKKRSVEFVAKISHRQIILFCRQIASLYDAGIPIVQCLEILTRGPIKPEFKELLMQVKLKLQKGMSLSNAFSDHRQQLNSLLIHFMAIGEETGSLTVVLKDLANYLEKISKLKQQVMQAVLYPGFLIFFSLSIFFIFIFWIIPQFDLLFQELGSNLPPLTQFLVNLSHIHLPIKFLLPLGLLILVIGIFFYRHISYLILKTPFLGDFVKNVLMIRFARTLAISLTAGIDLLSALELVQKILEMDSFRNALVGIRVLISQGRTLKDSMASTKCFPDLMLQMIEIGEESGHLVPLLIRAAETYEDQMNQKIQIVNRFLEPAIMAILGVFIGILIIAMYIPIFQIGQGF